MSHHRCHLCEQPNLSGARFCVECGVGLALQCARCGTVRPGPALYCPVCGEAGSVAEIPEATMLPPPRPVAPVRRRPPPGFEPSEWGGLPVLSLDDAVTVPIAGKGSVAPLLAAVRIDADGDLASPVVDFDSARMELRDMDDPAVWVMPDGQPLPPPPSSPGVEWVRTDTYFEPSERVATDDCHEGDVDIEIDLMPPSPAEPPTAKLFMPLAPPAEPASLPASTGFVDHRDAKAARRAAVRRARLAAQAEGVTLEPMPTDLLVVDSDDVTRQRLCVLLDAFGFNVQSSRSPAHAVSLLASRVYLAVFADVDLQDNRPDGGVEVCRLAREGGPLPDGRRPALVIMSSRASPGERVRAALAGSEQFLVKPLTRGHVARALEACDIPLPNDPRRLAATDPLKLR